MSFFVYRALTPDQRRIRLVTLLPRRSPSSGEDADEQLAQNGKVHNASKVFCTLSHVSLDQPPDYRAVSYTWGDPNDVAFITVNGNPFQVRKTLEIALRHLTHEDQSVTLWIDALCIDQDDEVEKTEQVRQMDQIYRRATSVMTWLGSATKESDAAMHWIQRYGALSYKFAIGSKPELRLGWLLRNFEAREESIEDEGLRGFLQDVSSQLTPGGSENDVIYALREFFKRPYWSRIWVVQEVAHGQDVEFVCGKEKVSEEVLHHALRLLRNFADYQHVKEAQHPQAINSDTAKIRFSTRNPINLLKIRRAAGPFPLIHLIRALKRFRATDPRDKIFALLSFASDAVALELSPDYQKTVNQVYVRTTATLIRHGYFEILSYCEAQKKIANLPSWVPDFTAPISRSPMQQRAIDRVFLPESRKSGGRAAIPSILQPKFRASEPETQVRMFCNMDEDSPSLVLDAKLVDKVDRVGTPWKSGFVGRWLQETREISLSSSCLEPIPLRAVLRTVVADQDIRQANDKPRLPEARLEKAYDLVQNMELAAVTAENLFSSASADYLYQLQETARGRRPFGTTRGHFGLGPSEMEPGDILCILAGASVPHVLRPQSNGELGLVGEAYAHGMMDGEMFQDDASVERIAIR